MNKTQDPEAAETVQTTSVPAVAAATACSACVDYQNAMVRARKAQQAAECQVLDFAVERHESRDNMAKALGIQTGREKWWGTTDEEKELMLLARVKKIRQNVQPHPVGRDNG